MSFQLNPLGISGPPSNYVQPNTGNPTVNAEVANYPVGADSLDIAWPVPAYTQPNYGSTPAVDPAWPLGQSSPPFVTLQ